MRSKSIVLYGASGHGKVVAEIAELNNFHIDYFIDNNKDIQQILGYRVSHIIPEQINHLFISIGNNGIRESLNQKFENTQFITLVHPSAIISKRATIGNGTVIMAGVSINSCAEVGDQCILNTNASIDHDCKIGNFVHISPNAALAGEVEVGEGTHIGIGAAILPQVKIGKWCTIGAGAIIIKDVPDGATVVGNPGRIIKTSSFKI